MIIITSKVDGYRRCGILHAAIPTTYPEDHFTSDQLHTLATDPILTVEIKPERHPGILDSEGLKEMTVENLKKLAVDMEITLPDKARKQEIIDLIVQASIDRAEGED